MAEKTTLALWQEYQQQEAIFWENAQNWAKTQSPAAQQLYTDASYRMKSIFTELDSRGFFKQAGKRGRKK